MTDHFIKDPDATLDYTWDWTLWCAGNKTIISAVIILPPGLTAVGEPIVTSPTVSQVISGGTLSETYKATCRVTTAGGIIDDRSLWITIRDR
ncbi:hypothetical protein AB0M28_13510 [Streptomyces sp. NPDC051940]|uniref:phage fiber-tail adaptor protein n=1 Tax=Streptomyces sp. NPDC051940 TaxID=3155675 RepID=UPI00341657C9